MIKNLFLKIIIFTTFLLTSACNPFKEDPRFKKKYIVIPAARFVQKQDTSPSYPACPTADYPLFCGEGKGCCGENYSYGCPALERCYSNPPPESECAGGWVQCMPPNVLISGISPHEATLRPGQSVDVSVSFRQWGTAALQKMIVKVSGTDGEFEQDLTSDDIAAGRVNAAIRIAAQKPDLSECLQECSRTENCGPCFVETNLAFWPVYFRLVDETGAATGNVLEWLSLTYEPESSSGGECTDASRCCTSQDDCGGGIGCQIVGITVPESCGQCPAGTTLLGVDVHYHLLQCSCDACSGK